MLAGNWKMNMNVTEACALSRALAAVKIPEGRQVMIAPSFVCLNPVFSEIKNSAVKLGCQNFYHEEKGAFTGEISSDMLKSTGVSHIIIGHSERRAIFGETNELINKKVKKALEKGFTAVLCCGETLQEREKNIQNNIVEQQISEGLVQIPENMLERLIIAYEPVWAIGTGKTASPGDAEAMHLFIRSLIEKLYSKKTAAELQILYGGSVTEKNVDELMAMPDIDGGLVGGASLKADIFTRIIQFK